MCTRTSARPAHHASACFCRSASTWKVRKCSTRLRWTASGRACARSRPGRTFSFRRSDTLRQGPRAVRELYRPSDAAECSAKSGTHPADSWWMPRTPRPQPRWRCASWGCRRGLGSGVPASTRRRWSGRTGTARSSGTGLGSCDRRRGRPPCGKSAWSSCDRSGTTIRTFACAAWSLRTQERNLTRASSAGREISVIRPKQLENFRVTFSFSDIFQWLWKRHYGPNWLNFFFFRSLKNFDQRPKNYIRKKIQDLRHKARKTWCDNEISRNATLRKLCFDQQTIEIGWRSASNHNFRHSSTGTKERAFTRRDSRNMRGLRL